MISKDEAPHPYASDMMDAYKSLNTTGVITTNAPAPKRWNFCPSCGTKLEPAWRHCPECGGVIGQTAAPWTPISPVYPNTGPWNPGPGPTWTGVQPAIGGITIGDPCLPLVGGTTYGPKPGDQITYTA